MSKRLQVLLDEAEYQQLERLARQDRLTVSEWVRRALRRAGEQEPSVEAGRKLEAVRAAVRHEYPTADIEQMIREIEQGYTEA
jgi:hypothetical protein